LLLEKPEINVNTKNVWDNFPLHEACKTNNVELVNLLLSHENSKNKINVNAKNSSGITYLYVACTRNYIDIVELLLSRSDIEVNADNYELSPLYGACNSNQIEIIKLLLNHKKIKVFPFIKFRNNFSTEVISVLIQNKNKEINKILKILDEVTE
jgi:ankyrin repeat protein